MKMKAKIHDNSVAGGDYYWEVTISDPKLESSTIFFSKDYKMPGACKRSLLKFLKGLSTAGEDLLDRVSNADIESLKKGV